MYVFTLFSNHFLFLFSWYRFRFSLLSSLSLRSSVLLFVLSSYLSYFYVSLFCCLWFVWLISSMATLLVISSASSLIDCFLSIWSDWASSAFKLEIICDDSTKSLDVLSNTLFISCTSLASFHSDKPSFQTCTWEVISPVLNLTSKSLTERGPSGVVEA